jgi:hypothetical protein
LSFETASELPHSKDFASRKIILVTGQRSEPLVESCI